VAHPSVSTRATRLLLLVTALMAWAAPSTAADLVLSTGPAKGSYHYIGERLKTELLVGHEQRIELVASAGSSENLTRLDDPESPVNVALTQADVLSLFLKENPRFTDRFVQLGDVGKECAFLIGSARSPATTFTELKTAGGKVSIGGDDSGAKVTFNSLASLDPSLARLRPVSVPTLEAVLQLQSPRPESGLAAAMIVQRPRRVSPAFEHVLRHGEAYRWIPIRQAEVAGASLPDGSPLYTFERVEVGGVRGKGLAVDTLCTRGLLLAATEKLTAAQRALLSEVMREAGPRIVGRVE
jgi:hypothetical protein